MNTTYKVVIYGLLGLLFYACCPEAQKESMPDKPNILFISIDDLRPQLGCYGNRQMKTPYMDALAKEGVLFSNTYCQVPTCGASRASLLTSLRPTKKRFSMTRTYADKEVPYAISLPEHLKNNGYYTLAGGKIFHSHKDSPNAWSEPTFKPSQNGGIWRDYALEENQKMLKELNRAPAYESVEANDTIYRDGKLAEWGIQKLRESAQRDQPFFLGVGFVKPHLPFQAPKKYWDMYSEGDIKLAPNPFPPKNAPEESLHDWVETRFYSNVPNEGPIPEDEALKMIHGYYASTSFVDAQVGKLLKELERLGLDKNTIVVLWGDHGWQLGEHGLWDKHTNYRHSLHSPLIYRIPWMKGGLVADGLNEFIDIYPTLCELTGVSQPASVQGMSLVKMLKEPSHPGKTAVFSRYQETNPLHGHTVRTEQFSYTEYSDSLDNVVAKMLFDVVNDPDENINLAQDIRYKEEVKFLSDLLKMMDSQS
jgi:arylsulfatase A-like enzyme